MGASTSPSDFSKKVILGGVAIGIFIILLILLIFLLAPSTYAIAFSAFLLGGIILVCGYYHLIYKLPKMTKDMETRISMEALRTSFWLVIFGLVMIILGLLYLMNLLPPPGW